MVWKLPKIITHYQENPEASVFIQKTITFSGAIGTEHTAITREGFENETAGTAPKTKPKNQTKKSNQKTKHSKIKSVKPPPYAIEAELPGFFEEEHSAFAGDEDVGGLDFGMDAVLFVQCR